MDGVDGEVLHTTLGFRLFWLADAELQRACFRVYNDWLSEFCSHSPRRLVGLGLISLVDIEVAVEELRRCAHMGLKGALIWNSAPDDRPYSSSEYDPFWRAAQELEMPLALHSLTGFHESRIPLSYIFHNVFKTHEIERTLATFLVSGIFERFPDSSLCPSRTRGAGSPISCTAWRRGRPGQVLFPTKPQHEAQGVFPSQRVRHPHRRPGGHPQPGVDRGRQPDVVFGLSTLGFVVAPLAGCRGARIPRLAPDVRRKVCRGNVVKLYHVPEDSAGQQRWARPSGSR